MQQCSSCIAAAWLSKSPSCAQGFSFWSAGICRVRIPIRELPDNLEQDLWLELQHPKKEVSLLCAAHMFRLSPAYAIRLSKQMATSAMPFHTA